MANSKFTPITTSADGKMIELTDSAGAITTYAPTELSLAIDLAGTRCQIRERDSDRVKLISLFTELDVPGAATTPAKIAAIEAALFYKEAATANEVQEFVNIELAGDGAFNNDVAISGGCAVITVAALWGEGDVQLVTGFEHSYAGSLDNSQSIRISVINATANTVNFSSLNVASALANRIKLPSATMSLTAGSGTEFEYILLGEDRVWMPISKDLTT